MMFSTPELILWDGLRWLCFVLCPVVVGLIMFSIFKPRMLWHQKLRMLCEAGFAVAVVDRYVSTLGQIPDRWWLNLGVALLMLGLFVGHAAFLWQYRLPRE